MNCREQNLSIVQSVRTIRVPGGYALLRHLQALDADQSIRHRQKSEQLRRHRHDVARTIQEGDRQIAPQRLSGLLIHDPPLAGVGQGTSLLEQPVDCRVAVAGESVALARVQELKRIAIRVDAA